MLVVPPLPAENRATNANISPPIIRNRRGRLRAERAHQGLRNTPDRELENPSFQVPRGRLQDNRARSERGTTRRARRGSGPRGTRRNPSAFEVEDKVVVPLYIEVKNLSYVLVRSRWDGGNSNSNVVIGSYGGGSKVVRKVLIRLRLILSMLIMTTTTVLNVVIPVLDTVKRVLDIGTP